MESPWSGAEPLSKFDGGGADDLDPKSFDDFDKVDDDENDFGKKTPLPDQDHGKRAMPSPIAIQEAMAAKIPQDDPPDDRVVASVTPIPRRPLTEEMLFVKDDGRLPDLDLLKTHFLREGKITHACAVRIIKTASSIFRKEPNLLHLRDPITVCGDLHGQYYDMMRLLQVGGDPGEVQYLFLVGMTLRSYWPGPISVIRAIMSIGDAFRAKCCCVCMQ
jgi:hypothetical protein